MAVLLIAVIWPASPFAISADAVLAAPSWRHPCGTDELGRDVLARLILGGRATLGVAIPAAGLAWGLGLAYGLAAALAPAWLAVLLLRLLDAALALPGLVVLMVAASLAPHGWASLVLVLGGTLWPPLARLVRNEAAALLTRPYVLASRQLGAGLVHLAWVQLRPAMAGFLAANAGLLLADATLGLSSLSFLGLGVQPPGTAWGLMLNEGLQYIDLGCWWLVLPPGGLIMLSVVLARAAGARLAGAGTARA